MQGAYDTDEGYIRMNEEVSRFELEKDDKDSSTHRLYYFALPPSVYPEVSEKVRKHCMNPSKLSYHSYLVYLRSFIFILTALF